MDLCRACLSTAKDLTLMDNIFVDKFNLLTNLNIIHSEDSPMYTCRICFDAVLFCVEFREKCLLSDMQLTLKENLFPSDNAIKDEFNSEEDTKEVSLKKEYVIKSENNSDVDELCDYQVETLEEFSIINNNECESDKSVKNKKRKRRNSQMIIKNEQTPHEQLQNGIKRLTDYIEKSSEFVSDEVKKSKVRKLPNRKVKLKSDKDTLQVLKIEDDGKQHCGICTKKFDDMKSLSQHLDHHKHEQTCGLCIERFVNYAHILSHRIRHVPQNQMRCHLCFRKHNTTVALENHYLKKHNLGGENTQLLCKECLKAFRTPKRLTAHMLSVHCAIKFICDHCGKGCRTKPALKIHLQMHSTSRKYKCDICDYSTKFIGAFNNHKIAKHLESRVLCKTCWRPFKTQELLDKHTCKYAAGVLCPICGRRVRAASSFTRHMRSHSDVAKYKCERCPSKFKSKSGYLSHMNKHDGIRAFHCEYCPLSFYTQSVLVKHRRTHTGEKPYVCKICSKAFTGNNNLKVHMKIHGQHIIVKKNQVPDAETK